MGISKLRVKEDHVLQLRKLGVPQAEHQHPIGHQQSHQNHKLEPQIELQHLIERQRTLQHHKLDLLQKDLRHLTGQHHPVHQIGLLHPDRWDHLVLPVQVVHLAVVRVEAEVEDVKIFIVL